MPAVGPAQGSSPDRRISTSSSSTASTAATSRRAKASYTSRTVARLLLVGELIGRRIDAAAAEHGLDRGQGDVLFTLRRAGAPHRLSPTVLASSLLVSSGTMTNRLDRLESRGLVRRLPNPSDRRALDIELTVAGRELVDALVGEHVLNEQAMLAPLSARERDQLVRITRKLLAHLG